MNSWIYKQTITTPTGSQIDEIECPRCGYRQTVLGCTEFTIPVNGLLVLTYKRPSSCYVCGTELDPDDFFKKTLFLPPRLKL